MSREWLVGGRKRAWDAGQVDGESQRQNRLCPKQWKYRAVELYPLERFWLAWVQHCGARQRESFFSGPRLAAAPVASMAFWQCASLPKFALCRRPTTMLTLLLAGFCTSVPAPLLVV